MFPGHNTIATGCASKLYKNDQSFRKIIEQLDPLFQDVFEHSIFGYFEDVDNQVTQINNAILQSVGYAIHAATHHVWLDKGVSFDCFYGHSLGEISAAYAAGVFSLEDGFKLVSGRGKLIEDMNVEGGMVLVPKSKDEAVALSVEQGYKVEAAVVIDSNTTIVSGKKHHLDALIKHLKRQRIGCVRLPVNRPGHSKYMELLWPSFRKICEEVNFLYPNKPVISNLDGTRKLTELSDPNYWCRQLRQTVRFDQCMKEISRYSLAIEFGTGEDISSMVSKYCQQEEMPEFVPT